MGARNSLSRGFCGQGWETEAVGSGDGETEGKGTVERKTEDVEVVDGWGN